MIRRIVHIDEEKCNGCGLCAQACHESAIGMVNGKAKLLRDDYCDGLGDCLPACPAGAISFIEREAAAYDEAAVLENKKKKAAAAHQAPAGGCPGTRMRQMNRRSEETAQEGENTSSAAPVTSQLSNWPVQIKLAPIKAPYFDQAKLLIRENSLNFTEIANTLGYSSIHYFSRQFKKITGMTPSEYSGSIKKMIEEDM